MNVDAVDIPFILIIVKSRPVYISYSRLITCLLGLVLCVIYFYLFTGKECPVTAYDKDGVRVLLHFATDHPPGRPDVLVVVVSMLNTAPLLVKNVVLQVAVPKVRSTMYFLMFC